LSHAAACRPGQRQQRALSRWARAGCLAAAGAPAALWMSGGSSQQGSRRGVGREARKAGSTQGELTCLPELGNTGLSTCTNAKSCMWRPDELREAGGMGGTVDPGQGPSIGTGDAQRQPVFPPFLCAACQEHWLDLPWHTIPTWCLGFSQTILLAFPAGPDSPVWGLCHLSTPHLTRDSILQCSPEDPSPGDLSPAPGDPLLRNEPPRALYTSVTKCW
jgi:hypothetical protein